MHKAVMHDVKQLQDELDITTGTDAFPIQNDGKVQEIAKYRDEDEANKQ